MATRTPRSITVEMTTSEVYERQLLITAPDRYSITVTGGEHSGIIVTSELMSDIDARREPLSDAALMARGDTLGCANLEFVSSMSGDFYQLTFTRDLAEQFPDDTPDGFDHIAIQVFVHWDLPIWTHLEPGADGFFRLLKYAEVIADAPLPNQAIFVAFDQDTTGTLAVLDSDDETTLASFLSERRESNASITAGVGAQTEVHFDRGLGFHEALVATGVRVQQLPPSVTRRVDAQIIEPHQLALPTRPEPVDLQALMAEVDGLNGSNFDYDANRQPNPQPQPRNFGFEAY